MFSASLAAAAFAAALPSALDGSRSANTLRWLAYAPICAESRGAAEGSAFIAAPRAASFSSSSATAAATSPRA